MDILYQQLQEFLPDNACRLINDNSAEKIEIDLGVIFTIDQVSSAYALECRTRGYAKTIIDSRDYILKEMKDTVSDLDRIHQLRSALGSLFYQLDLTPKIGYFAGFFLDVQVGNKVLEL